MVESITYHHFLNQEVTAGFSSVNQSFLGIQLQRVFELASFVL